MTTIEDHNKGNVRVSFKVDPSNNLDVCPDVFFEIPCKYINANEACKHYNRSLVAWKDSYQFTAIMESWKLQYGKQYKWFILVTRDAQGAYHSTEYVTLDEALAALSKIEHYELPEGIYIHHYLVPFLMFWLSPMAIFPTMNMITNMHHYALDLTVDAVPPPPPPMETAAAAKHDLETTTTTREAMEQQQGKKKIRKVTNTVVTMFDLTAEMTPGTKLFYDNHYDGYNHIITFSRSAAAKLVKKYPKAVAISKECKYNPAKCRAMFVRKRLIVHFAIMKLKRNNMFKPIDSSTTTGTCSISELVEKINDYISSECC